jgi:hypothetical protein
VARGRVEVPRGLTSHRIPHQNVREFANPDFGAPYPSYPAWTRDPRSSLVLVIIPSSIQYVPQDCNQSLWHILMLLSTFVIPALTILYATVSTIAWNAEFAYDRDSMLFNLMLFSFPHFFSLPTLIERTVEVKYVVPIPRSLNLHNLTRIQHPRS